MNACGTCDAGEDCPVHGDVVTLDAAREPMWRDTPCPACGCDACDHDETLDGAA